MARGDAQKILDEALAKGQWLAPSIRDALIIEAHNDRCDEAQARRRFLDCQGIDKWKESHG